MKREKISMYMYLACTIMWLLCAVMYFSTGAIDRAIMAFMTASLFGTLTYLKRDKVKQMVAFDKEQEEKAVVESDTDTLMGGFKAAEKLNKRNAGYWIDVEVPFGEDDVDTLYKCSVCGKLDGNNLKCMAFCPWCGAEMTGEVEVK